MPLAQSAGYVCAADESDVMELLQSECVAAFKATSGFAGDTAK